MALTKIGTDGVKDDAVTSGKIPANAVGSSELADQSVSLDKLPHGTSSNNGKFLRANNGADPSFETVSIPAGTTINNNADNKVITGSGSANTLEGEANLTFDGTSLNLPNANQFIKGGGHNVVQVDATKTYLYGGTGGVQFRTADNSAELVNITNDGKVGIKNTNMSSFNDGMDDLVIGNGASNTSPGMTIFSHATDIGTISFRDVADTGISGLIQYRHNESPPYMKFMVEGTQRMSITTHGGIAFNSDTAAANTLSDYEEGSWTPTLNSGTVSTSHAKYIRIGNMCWINAGFTNASDTTSSTAIMIPQASLPFNKAAFADNIIMGTCPHRYFSYSTKDTLLHWVINGSGIQLQSSNDAFGDKAFSTVLHQHIDASYSDFNISGWYTV